MTVWLITVGEPLPGRKERLHRTGLFADYLACRDNEVIWWTSSFDHFNKKHIFDRDTTVNVKKNLQLEILHGSGYKRNVSLARIKDHRQIAEKFSKKSRSIGVVPEIIVAALPTIELCVEAVRFGHEKNVPVVLDMRDMWPDIFAKHVPVGFRWLASIALRSIDKATKSACGQATAITGITEKFVDWGLSKAGRMRNEYDEHFPMSYVHQPAPPDDLLLAEKFWREKGIDRDKGQFIVSFVGTIGYQFDLDLVVLAARELERRGADIQFVICGAGERLNHYHKVCKHDRNILLPGWINAAQIQVLLRLSRVGLNPLLERVDLMSTLNNKAVEYFSAGLPVISTPDRGLLRDFLLNEECGMSVDAGHYMDLADLLLHLQSDTAKLEALAFNARRVYEEKFRPEVVFHEMSEYLDRVVRHHRKLHPESALSV